jgi:hypothetical protein
MHEILPLVCNYLNAAGAEYVVIGGIVVSIHGYPRSTIDLDVIISLEERALEKFLEFLKKNGFRTSMEDARVAFAERSHFTAEDTLSRLRLDIKGVYNEMDRRTISRRVKFRFMGTDIMIETPEDLIGAKLYFGCEQDIRDAEGVYQLQKDKLDMDYLDTVCKSYGVGTELEALKKTAARSSVQGSIPRGRSQKNARHR